MSNKQKKKKNKIRLEFDKKVIKGFFKGFLLGLFFIGLILSVTEILIPLVFGIVDLLISLVKLYFLLNPTAQFFGGFLFLFIFWKFFEAFFVIIFKGFGLVFKELGLIKTKNKLNHRRYKNGN